MPPIVIHAIVEGHGELQALPVLIRRIAVEIDPHQLVEVPRPLRVPRGTIVRELERYVELTARSSGATLLLLDADDDCPANLAPQLLFRAQSVRPGRPTSVVLAMREFEAWFLAAANSLAGRRGLDTNLEAPPEPESLRDAKGWLARHRVDGGSYSPTVDQPALAGVFDMTAARTGATSFDKLWRDVERLLRDTRP